MKAIYLLLSLALHGTLVSAKCNLTVQVEFCSEDPDPLKVCSCKPCKSCPAGYGPSHHCGARYPLVDPETKIKCIPCINGTTFSVGYGTSSCEGCNQCGNREILARCTPKNNAICGNKCKKGYIKNKILPNHCFRDPSFKTAPPKPTMPTPQLPKSIPITTQQPPKQNRTTTTTSTPTQDRKNIWESTNGTTELTDPDISKSGQNGKSDSREIKIILMLIVIAIAIVLVIVAGVSIGVYVFYKKYSRQDKARNQDEKKALQTDSNSTSPRSSQEEIVPWPERLCLKDIKVALRSVVANLITQSSTVVNGWRAIGEETGLSDNDLEGINVGGEKKNTTQGEQLLIKLASCQPRLTVTEFVEILKQLERNEVVNVIKEYYGNVTNRLDSVDQESQV